MGVWVILQIDVPIDVPKGKMRFVELRRERSYLGNVEDFCENFGEYSVIFGNTIFPCGPRLGRSSCSAYQTVYCVRETDLGFPPVAVARSGNNALWRWAGICGSRFTE